jgi:RNA polymerase sigma-70 factor (ECF subfamily)
VGGLAWRSGRVHRVVRLPDRRAALYAQAPTFEQTDWTQLVTLYGQLLSVWPWPSEADPAKGHHAGPD